MQYFQSLGLEFYYPNNDTLEKWMVNFISHDLTEYDSILKNHLFNSHENYFRTELKLGILHKISAVYLIVGRFVFIIHKFLSTVLVTGM